MTTDEPTLPPALDGVFGLDILLGLLDLREVGSAHISGDDVSNPLGGTGDSRPTVFVGQSHKQPHGRVFGGQVLAQSLMAAGRTLDLAPGAPPRPAHSLHAYFMRPGDDTQPIRFSVERMRDGRSFSTRRVHALQAGLPILSLSASFQERAGGVDHQETMPDVPGPEGIPSLAESLSSAGHGSAEDVRRRPVELRHVEGNLLFGPRPEFREPHQHVWMRAVDALPDDQLVHACVLSYASDYSLL